MNGEQLDLNWIEKSRFEPRLAPLSYILRSVWVRLTIYYISYIVCTLCRRVAEVFGRVFVLTGIFI